MISATTLCKKLLNVNGLVVDDADFFTNKYGELCILIKVHLRKGLQWKCPVCGKRYTRIYDAPYEHKRWRALDFGGSLFTLKHTFHAFAAKNMVSRPLMSHGHFQTRTLPKTLIIPSLGWASISAAAPSPNI